MVANGLVPATQQRIVEAGIVPVLRAKSLEQGYALVKAMVAGGIQVMEVTTTVPDAPGLLQRLNAEYGDTLLLGGGTITTVDQCEQMIAAGAAFIVSPSFHPEVIAHARARGRLMVCGALTPTEVIHAWRAGAHMIKVFPCSAMGGASYLRALRAPFPEIPLLPTGGITLDTAPDFLAAGAAALGVGSDLVDIAAIEAGEPERITQVARAYGAVIEAWRARCPA